MKRAWQHLYYALDSISHRDDPHRTCVRCGNNRFERLPRISFMQTHILPFFNVYPWRCVICGRVIHRTLRSNLEDAGEWR